MEIDESFMSDPVVPTPVLVERLASGLGPRLEQLGFKRSRRTAQWYLCEPGLQRWLKFRQILRSPNAWTGRQFDGALLLRAKPGNWVTSYGDEDLATYMDDCAWAEYARVVNSIRLRKTNVDGGFTNHDPDNDLFHGLFPVVSTRSYTAKFDVQQESDLDLWIEFLDPLLPDLIAAHRAQYPSDADYDDPAWNSVCRSEQDFPPD